MFSFKEEAALAGGSLIFRTGRSSLIRSRQEQALPARDGSWAVILAPFTPTCRSGLGAAGLAVRLGGAWAIDLKVYKCENARKHFKANPEASQQLNPGSLPGSAGYEL